MFFDSDRIDAVREMILADNEQGRMQALAKLLPDAAARTSSGIFREMNGLPVTIRLLDPPLHEFLPALGRGAADAGREDRASPLSASSAKPKACTSSIRCSATAAAAWA